MLDLKQIRENPEQIQQLIARSTWYWTIIVSALFWNQINSKESQGKRISHQPKKTDPDKEG